MDLSEADSNKWVKLSDHVAKRNSSVEPVVAPKASRDGGDLWRPIKQKQRRFSADEELAVIADYVDGGTVYSLAAKYRCHRTTISRILKSHGVRLANAPIDPATVGEIVRLRASGLSMEATARQTHVSAKTVFNYVHTRSAEHEIAGQGRITHAALDGPGRADGKSLEGLANGNTGTSVTRRRKH